MLFKKIVEKYYTEESLNTPVSNNQINLYPAQNPRYNNTSLNPPQNSSYNNYAGFDNTSIQKFTFDILEEINEIEEERRNREMKEREELAQLRYLELQRVLYNLQFNMTTPIDRETKNRLKEMVLNMTIDELKNKYKTEFELQTKKIHVPAETCHTGDKQDKQPDKMQSKEMHIPAGTCHSDEMQTTLDLANDNDNNNNDNDIDSILPEILDIHTPAGICQAQIKLDSNEENELECVEQANKIVETVTKLYEEAGEIESEIRNCMHSTPKDIYTINNKMKVKEISYDKKKQFISIDNIIYSSLKEASAKLNINKATILWRLKSTNDKFNNYIYVNANTNVNVNVDFDARINANDLAPVA